MGSLASTALTRSMTTDGNGNIFTTGVYGGVTDYDPGNSVFNLSSNVFSRDIFICKFDASGKFVWAKSTGGSLNDDKELSITLDASENVFVSGH